MAATVAVGVGVALARAERERRSRSGRRDRDGRFALIEGERLGAGLRRIALGQLDIAIEMLEDSKRGLSPEQRVHEARKALKRLRALLRLVQDELGDATYEREHELVRRCGTQLAKARDAEVLLATLDGLIAREPKQLGARGGVRRLRARLQSERDGAAALALAESATHAGVLGDLRAMRVRVSTWELADEAGIEAIEPALRRVYSKGRRRMRRAKRARGDRARGRKLHEWRKRVKDLRYTAEVLERAQADKRSGKRSSADNANRDKHGAGKHGSKRARKQARAGAAFVHELAKRADDLGEVLGEEHDLAVLAERVRAEAKRGNGSRAPGAGARKALLKAIARRRKRLRGRALRDGKRLYAREPKQLLRRVRAAQAAARLSRR
ncbi:MAG TPA: CHAD domain-containing protein [Solirubrobacteraceae bacterium]|nr:CHAD domain-containing protein [Solirubrobacteraceae bacterium]